MPTGVVLDPLAQERLVELQGELELHFGVEASQRSIASAAVYGASAATLVGMHIAFIKAKAVRDAATPKTDD